MKTITYNPETHVLVPREPTRDMVIAGTHQRFRDSYDAEEDCYRAMIAAAPQPETNHNWCAGCSPDNCSGCGADPVCEWVKADGANYLRQKWHKDYVAVEGDKLYTMPQPGRTAELEAELTALKAENESLRKDAERYRWLRDATGETPLRPAAFGSEMYPDLRLKLDFPTIVSYDAVGNVTTLDQAIDALAKGEQ